MKYFKFIAFFYLLFFSTQLMAAQQTVDNGDSGLLARTKINANDTELYSIKADKVTGGTENNILTLDSSGNPKDSGATINIDGSISTPAASGGGSIILKDDDAPSTTDKEMARVAGSYVNGADTAENGIMAFAIKLAGSFVDFITLDPTTDAVIFEKNTTLQAGDIINTEIADGTIEADKLEATNSPTNGYYPAFDSATGGVTWSLVTGGTGYTATPTYSDDPCTLGQYSWDASYYYGCESTNQWDRYPVTWASWNNPTPSIPTLTSATIPTTGDTVSLLFSEAITIGSGGNGGWTLNTPTNAMTYSSGDTTNTLVYNLASTINSTDTPTISYTQPGDGLESATGGDLASIVAGAVTNNSTQGGTVTIAYVSVSTATGSSTVTGTLPVGTVDDNIMIASVLSDDGNNTVTPPIGWTAINSITQSTSVIQSVFYKIASSESGTYEFTTTFSAPSLLHIVSFSKSSGSWAAPTGVNLNNTSANATDTNVTGSVTIPTGALLYCSWANDGVRTVITPPSSPMTEILEEQTSDLSMASYYENGLSGATTKTLIWSTADENTSSAVVLGAE